LGGHGDTMVPVPEYSTVNGVSINQLLPADKIEEINTRTQHGGAEIVKHLKTGSAYYAPSASAVAMVEAILLDSDRILPVCAYLQGEYGLSDVYCGVPAALGKDGISRVIEIDLSDASKKALHSSADQVRELSEKVLTLV